MMEENRGGETSGSVGAEHDQEGSLRGRVVEGTRHALERARDGLSTGAAEVAEKARAAASETRDRAGQLVEFVREAQPDEHLKETVSGGTERSIDRAGEALIGAAPAIGRGAEKAATKLGEVLHSVAHPLAVVLGAIAGTLGGWWKKAAEERYDLPLSEEEACRAHFQTLQDLAPDLDYNRARTGYAFGYVASRNPGYRGRSFDEVEPELRQGFGTELASDYDLLRDFTRYGYDRGTGTSF
jgi:hypothetical protein